MVENGKIYKYTNLINNKIYIGQTKSSLEQRDKKHLQQLDDGTYFHRAIKKYGRNNFSLELVEENIPYYLLDNREKYWIDYFDSFYTTGKGYNLTQGGQWGSGTQILTIKQADEIKNKIHNTNLSLSEIANSFNVSLSTVSDINTGRTFIDNNILYPIRKMPQKSILTQQKLEQIIQLLQTTNLSQESIGKKVGVLAYTVGEINRGRNSWCPKDLNYPIRKSVQKSTYQNILTPNKVQNICYDLCFTNMTLENIGKKYGVAKNTIGDISRGISWKNITHQFQCPIRKNKLENQKIYQSIYGIV